VASWEKYRRADRGRHYVAFVRKTVGPDDTWVLFNDEKVVNAATSNVDEMKKFAYVYFFMRA
jgi:ubiquitin carboxyl-terminal hydrolase 5/13